MDKPTGQQPPKDENNAGVNPYELPNLPEDQRRVLRVIMKKREISYAELSGYIAELPEEERIDVDNLDDILENLSQGGHIIVLEEGEAMTFKPNLRQKSGRNLMIKGIWDVLDAASEKVDGATEQRRKTSNMASKLYAALDDLKDDKPSSDKS